MGNKSIKLLIVGSDKIFSIENYYVKYIRELGIEIETFNAQSFFYDYYQRSIVNKLIFRSGLSRIYKKINTLFRKKVEEFKPDVIWVFKGMEILPGSLQWAREKGIALVNYNPDNPFIFTGAGSGNQNVIDSISLYQLHFTYNLDIQKRLGDEHKIRTAYLPFGFDLSDDLFAECTTQQEICKACFLGNPDKQRAAFILALAQNGIKIDLYGNNWYKFVKHENILSHPAVYGNELWKVLRRYRVQLNLMRVHNENSHNMRTFEVPGVGGIMVAPETSEHKLFFESGKEVFLYKDVEDCIEKINYILQLSEIDACAIRDAARKKSIDAGYSYKDRAFAALSAIKLLHA